MILGISVSTRVVSMAAIDCNTIIDYKVRLFKERWSALKCKRIIQCIATYSRNHTITTVALMLPQVHHRSLETRELIRKIKLHCKKNALSFHCFHLQDLHSFTNGHRAKKKALMRELCNRYPDL